MCGEPSGFLKGPVRQLFPFAAYDDVGSRNIIGVEPPVIRPPDSECDLLVLIIVLSDIDVKAVRGEEVERLCLLRSFSAVLILFLYEALFGKLVPYLIQVGLVTRGVE